MGGSARSTGNAGPPLSVRASGWAALLLAAAIAGCTGGQAGEGDDSASSLDSASAGTTAVADVALCVPPEARITGDGLGEIRVRRAVAELRERCMVRDTTFTLGEGSVEQGLVADTPGGPVIALHTGGDQVTRVIVNAPGVTTPEAIGVGSTIGDVRRAYPRACVLVGEGRLVVAVAALPGLSLGTTADFGTLVRGASAPPLAALPDTARVSSLWAVGADSDICS